MFDTGLNVNKKPSNQCDEGLKKFSEFTSDGSLVYFSSAFLSADLYFSFSNLTISLVIS